MDKQKIIFDSQYLDNNYQKYYFIPWPECQYFDEIGDDDQVIPVSTQSMVGSFVDEELIGNLEIDPETDEQNNK